MARRNETIESSSGDGVAADAPRGAVPPSALIRGKHVERSSSPRSGRDGGSTDERRGDEPSRSGDDQHPDDERGVRGERARRGERHVGDEEHAPASLTGVAAITSTVADVAEAATGPIVSAATIVAENATAPIRSVAASVSDIAEGAVAPIRSVASSFADIADGATEPFRSVARPVVEGVETGVSHARQRLERSDSARARRVRAASRHPLPVLFDVHPEARRASIRDLGVQTVPVDAIAGTAVEGPAQRRGDFRPPQSLRGRNWEARWQRIQKAIEELKVLPPIDVLKFGDEYWVVDGHNRVAAALYAGQVAIDAAVRDLRVPGSRRTTVEAAPGVLETGRELRAARRGSRRASTQRVEPCDGAGSG